MIAVCELQCKGISHEKVNSGFLHGLLLAYPKEEISFFAEQTHFQALKRIFNNSKTNFKNIKLVKINFNANKSFSFEGIVSYYLLIKKIFNKLLSFGENRIFFLSNSPIILYVVKKLKQQKKYKNINCTFVLHGELEDIATKKYKKPYIPVISNRPVAASIRIIIPKLLENPKRTFSFLVKTLIQPLAQLYSQYSLIFKRKFRTKKMMMWQHSNQYNYISMSPHVTENAKKYINTDHLNFHTIVLPIIFAKPDVMPNNKFIKFAVFGYGDSAQMNKMLTTLSKKKITKSYEIKIISMDSRGTEEFPNITRLSRGNVLTRVEMEKAAQDVDVFINLYDRTRHRFGCSLSILEAFSYLKPVLHLSNPGYDYFNKPNKPIGFKVNNLDEFVEKMVDLIENYPRCRKGLKIFRNNMLEYRKKYAIENNLEKLKRSFTFKASSL